MTPTVTVLMSVFNGERYLSEAIESILGQTWEDLEFLIIDDGSTDSSREIVTSFGDKRIRLVENSSNMGLTKSLNVGLRLAKGALIARQDADDISLPNRIKVQVGYFQRLVNLALLGCQAIVVDGEGNKIAGTDWQFPLSGHAVRWALLFDNPFIHTSVMFRKEMIWNTLQGYDEHFKRAQDYELWSRVAATWEVRNLPDILVKRRVHGGSLLASDSHPNAIYSERIILRNLRKYLDNDEIPQEWARSIQRLRLDAWPNATEADLLRLLDLIGMIFKRFRGLHLAGQRDRDIRRYLALQYYRVARFSGLKRIAVFLKAITLACKYDAAMIIVRGVLFVKNIFQTFSGGRK